MNAITDSILILRGRLSSVEVEDTTASIFFTGSDQIGMAATGVLAAASGLSGIAAGMAFMSTDESHEPIVEARVVVNDQPVRALLWSFPFKEGDDVEIVGESLGGEFVAYAVLSPSKRLISLYPHVSSGSSAHLASVLKISAIVSTLFPAVAFLVFVALGTFMSLGEDWWPFVAVMAAGSAAVGVILFIIGIRIGNRFQPFVKMADRIFSALGWSDAKRISLRRISRERRLPGDPAELGDRYFRY